MFMLNLEAVRCSLILFPNAIAAMVIVLSTRIGTMLRHTHRGGVFVRARRPRQVADTRAGAHDLTGECGSVLNPKPRGPVRGRGSAPAPESRGRWRRGPTC